LAVRSDDNSTRLKSREAVGASVDENLRPLLSMRKAASPTAACAACGVTVSKKVLDYCVARPQRFGGPIYCFGHQRSVDARPGRRSLSKPRL
jgi:hypothetical protein